MKKFLFLFLLLGTVGTLCAHGISETDKQAIAEGGNLRYLWLGAIHMVTGYDHILFLFGVIFYLTGFKDILKFITVFTLGHSITLILATFMKITANYYLVDAVIALSVCYKAFDNLDGFRKYLKINPPNLPAMVFLFGLIHGFGLSTRLQQLPLPAEGLLARIVSFNVGVELGQVAALSVLLLLLAGWRKTESFRKMGGIANVLLLLAGIGLFFFQMVGFVRGEEHHHDEDHGAGIDVHEHGEGDHSHDDEEHTHEDGGHTHGEENLAPGQDAHSHGEEGHTQDSGRTSYGVIKPLIAPDTVADSAKLQVGTSHRHGKASHSHGGKAHTHAPKATVRDSAAVETKAHRHGEGVPHNQ